MDANEIPVNQQVERKRKLAEKLNLQKLGLIEN